LSDWYDEDVQAQASPKTLLRRYLRIPEPIRPIQKYPKPLWMAGRDPAIHAASASFVAVPNLGNIISALITWFSVLVDGRVKPGHDEKPKGRRCAVTSNS
jgi:hypothetical protein